MKLRTFKLLLFTILVIFAEKNYAQTRVPYEEHLVKKGETPASVARDFNIKVKDFLILNDFPPNVKLTAGQVVLIRALKEGEKSKEDIEAEKAAAANAPKGETATEKQPAKETKRKESAKETKRTESEAKTTEKAPAASTKAVEIGPGGTRYTVSPADYHVVEKGQTFYRIALIYGLTVDQLKQLNNMTNTNISVGQKLKVK